MNLRISIVEGEPPKLKAARGTHNETHSAIRELIDNLVINGKWAKIEGFESKRDLELARAAASFYASEYGARNGYKLRTSGEVTEDGSFILWLRKLGV